MAALQHASMAGMVEARVPDDAGEAQVLAVVDFPETGMAVVWASA